MASDLESKAKEAFLDDHFELAASLYSQAIDLAPANAELFADRAQANIKLQNLTDAVADANKAIELDPNLAKAYLRKGTACFKLEEYQTARAALQTGASLAPGNSRFTTLITECDQKIAEELGDLSGKSVQPESKPSVEAVAPIPSDPVPTQVAIPPAKPKYRHEHYQKPEEVVVTIFAKHVPPSCVAVDFGEQILSVHINIPEEDSYLFRPRLFAKILPEKSRYEVLGTKVEIHLAKAEPLNWTSLEYSKDPTVAQPINVSAVGTAQRPMYPSSNTKHVDWDKLEAEVKKEEKEEKLDGDAGLNKFFREIYGDADEDTRRAMQKSFVESNGTVLSTNWKEVGSKKVEGSPPDGMEMKKWEF